MECAQLLIRTHNHMWTSSGKPGIHLCPLDKKLAK